MAITHDKICKSIQDSLPKCIRTENAQPFIDLFDKKITESVKVCVETAVRYYVTQNLCSKNNTNLGKITAVTKLTIELARHEVCMPTLPILVLSDAFDALTVQQCEKLFTFVEANVAIWKEPLFFIPCKNQVLRMCNDVLRRLSRSQNTIFCGRILLFLARFFPFSERSGLNLISEFNLENVTTFSTNDSDDVIDTHEGKDESMEEEIKEVKECTEKESPKSSLDNTLYNKFWALQDFFRNPVQCYQEASWKTFTSYTSDVLEAFTSFKLDSSATEDPGSSTRSFDATMTDIEDPDKTILDAMPDVKNIDQYFAKFLTNRRLLDLQFNDSNFRRYVLLQLLILCDYLTASIKFRQENLKEAQSVWVRATEQKVYGLLKDTPPDGEQFAEIVKKILQRENQWNDWKNNGCPEIKKPEVNNAVATDTAGNAVKIEGDEDSCKRGKKRKLGDQIKEADSRNKFNMPNPEMTRLWNLCPDNVEATKLSKREFTPSLESYFTRAVEQITAQEDVPQADRLVHDSNFGWRALRLLACRSPHFFTHSTAPIATLPEYLTTMIRKLAKDISVANGRTSQRQQLQQPQLAASDAKIKAEEETNAHNDVDTEHVACEEDEEDAVDEDDNPREELQPLSSAEQDSLAAALADSSNWQILMKKLGFQDDEVDFILEQKGNKVVDCLKHFLQLWVENEGEEANRETIIYTLEGLKMQDVVSKAFP